MRIPRTMLAAGLALVAALAGCSGAATTGAADLAASAPAAVSAQPTAVIGEADSTTPATACKLPAATKGSDLTLAYPKKAGQENFDLVDPESPFVQPVVGGTKVTWHSYPGNTVVVRSAYIDRHGSCQATSTTGEVRKVNGVMLAVGEIMKPAGSKQFKAALDVIAQPACAEPIFPNAANTARWERVTDILDPVGKVAVTEQGKPYLWGGPDDSTLVQWNFTAKRVTGRAVVQYIKGDKCVTQRAELSSDGKAISIVVPVPADKIVVTLVTTRNLKPATVGD